MADRTLSVNIQTKDEQTLAALRRLERQFKDLDGSIDKVDRRGRGMSNMLGGLAIGAGLAYVTGEADEAAASLRSTQAVIESTGNAAEVSAEQQMKLVEELSKLGGVDDEVVNAGANILRTFTSIKGENFGLAMGAALDIAAMKGQDLSSVAEQLGKALNDPVTGMGKLAKQGVVLSETQKQLVRDLAAAGDTAGAQRVILQELEVEYGGQAEAMATNSGKFKVAIDNMAESVGTALAPAMGAAADKLTVVADGFGALPTPVVLGTLALAGFAKAAGPVADKLDEMPNGLRSTVGEMNKLDAGVAAAGAGLAAFGVTLAALESMAAFRGDLAGLGQDLTDFASGGATADEAIAEVAGSVEELAEKIRRANKDGIIDRLTADKFGADIRGAKNDLKALDEAFAAMVESGNVEGAEAAFYELTQELGKQGITAAELGGYMDNYNAALDRAARDTKVNVDASKAMGEALVEEAGKVDESTAKLNARRDALAAVNDETERSIGLALGSFAASQEYEDGVTGVKEAQLALAIAERDGNAADVAKARQDLENAMVAQAEAAVGVYEATAELNGEELTATARTAILRSEMDKARTTTGYWSGDLTVLYENIGKVAKDHEGRVNLNVEDAKRKMYELIAIQMLSAHLADPENNPRPGAPFLPYGTTGTMGPPSPPGGRANGVAMPRSATSGDGAPIGTTINVGTLNVGGVKGVGELTSVLDQRDRALARQIKRAS